jgi:hypothetical protein
MELKFLDLWADVRGPHADDWIWTDAHIAAFYDITLGTVKKKRCEGTLGLPYSKRGRQPVYRPSDAANDLQARMKPAPKPKPYVLARANEAVK